MSSHVYPKYLYYYYPLTKSSLSPYSSSSSSLNLPASLVVRNILTMYYSTNAKLLLLQWKMWISNNYLNIVYSCNEEHFWDRPETMLSTFRMERVEIIPYHGLLFKDYIVFTEERVIIIMIYSFMKHFQSQIIIFTIVPRLLNMCSLERDTQLEIR